ncbi:MAG TPA: hypothetical protein VL225_03345 [Vicinamibacterales bacterium]|jgi:hypothetical protein|nr:hypothetical protein [Vicinamibacterales bacterium]
MRPNHFAASIIVSFTCLAMAPGAIAGQRQPAPAPAAREGTAATARDTVNAEDTRQRLEDVLKEYPPSLPRILHLDPTLLDNAAYLQPYPELAAFLTQHPEVKHNPSYFLGDYEGNNRDPRFRLTPQDRAIDMWRSTIEGFTIGTVLLGVASALIWLIKTLVEYRRWSRLSKIQTDVHNKLLDRFTSNEDLLAYIQTPAGRKFLESSPIPLDSPRSISAPLGRILWSAQAGAVLTVLGIGFEVVSQSTLEEIAAPLAALGAVIIALGIGFVVSALLAYMLSRRFGLMHDPGAVPPEARG